MKRRWWTGFLSLMVVLSLTACGASSNADSMAYEIGTSLSKTEESFDYAAETPIEAVGDTENGVLADQKIIYTGDLNLETTDFDSTVNALTGLAESLGGYLERSTVGGSSYRWADYTVRVPTDKFQSFLTQAGGLAHVTWQNTEQQNITETYYDTEGRLKTQQIKLDRLQDLLAKAENMEDIITIESAISETEWSIENLSGTLRHYDALVDYATVNINVQEVYKYSNAEEMPENFGDRLGSAFSRGLSTFGDTIEDLLVALAYNWLWVLLLAVVIAAAVPVLRKVVRWRKARKTEQAQQKNPEKSDDNRENT